MPVDDQTAAAIEPSALGSRVTVAVVPRERFSFAVASLASVLANTDPSVRIVYVDAGSPVAVSRQLQDLGRARATFTYLRQKRFLSPNEARNVALDKVNTEFVAFVDNDLVVEPGWLEPLLKCADETGADLVGPLYLEGGARDARVHMAGGLAHIEIQDCERYLIEKHFHPHESIASIAGGLCRTQTELLEFHCMLVRRDIFGKFGKLDQRLLSLHEHVDLCMTVRAGGGIICLEPASVVRYSFEGPLRVTDLPYMVLRWSEEWTERTLDAFRQKWQLSGADRSLGFTMQFGRDHRKALVKQYLPRRLRHTRVGTAVAFAIELLALVVGRMRYRPGATDGSQAMRPTATQMASALPGPL